MFEEKKPILEVCHDLDVLTDYYSEAFISLDQFDLSPALEGFIGKTDNLKKIELSLAPLCERYRDTDLLTLSTANIDGSPEIKMVEKLISDEFGFGSTNIIVFNKTVMNAYTCLNSRVIRDLTTGCPTLPTRHGEKYYDSKHSLFVYICLYAELFRYLTPGEIVALLLHEIFHCLDLTTTYFIMDVIGWILALPNPLAWLFKIIGPHYAFIKDKIWKILDYLVIPPILENLGLTANKFAGMALGPLGGACTMMEFLRFKADQLMHDPLAIPAGFFGVAMEHFADTGVTAYGYSAEFISAMKKMDEYDIITHHGKLPEFWTMSANAFTWLPLLFLDPHPHVSSRTKNTLLLAKELANDPNMPKSYRTKAMANYKAAEKAYKRYLDVQEDERERGVLSWTRNCQDKWFPHGVDFRTYFLGMGACATK